MDKNEGVVTCEFAGKIIVAGGRDFRDWQLVVEILNSIKKPFSIVCGKARGADALGERYAKENGLEIHYFPANWAEHGKSAGYLRNREMADYADCLIAFWDGISRGTGNMIGIAKAQKKPVMVVRY